MSKIFAKLKSRNLELRKAKDALAKELTFLISNIQLEAKTKDPVNQTITDSLVIASVRSQIKKMNETISLAGDKVDTTDIQKGISELETLLPTAISEDQLKTDIVNILGDSEKSIKLMGKIMGQLKAKYGDQLDGAVASKVVKEYLA